MMVILVGRIKKQKGGAVMILVISDYSYNCGGVLEGSYFQSLLYYQDGQFYRKSKEFSQDPSNIYPSHSLPKIQELSENEILDYSNFLPIGSDLLLDMIKDPDNVYKFYRNPYRNIHSYILTKIMRPYQIDW